MGDAWEWGLAEEVSVSARIERPSYVESLCLGPRLVSRSGAAGKLADHVVQLPALKSPPPTAEVYRASAGPREAILTFDPAPAMNTTPRVDGVIVPPTRVPDPDVLSLPSAPAPSRPPASATTSDASSPAPAPPCSSRRHRRRSQLREDPSAPDGLHGGTKSRARAARAHATRPRAHFLLPPAAEVIVMGLAHEVGKNIGRAIAPFRAGSNKLASRKIKVPSIRTLEVKSASFDDGGTIPVELTADGAGTSPAIMWSDPPPAARSIVVLAEDPDAPFPNPFVHWLVFNIPSTARALGGAPDAASIALQGKNSMLKEGYTPPAPPAGHGVHHYHFQVFALDTVLDLDHGVGRGRLLDSMENHVLAWGEIVGTYERT